MNRKTLALFLLVPLAVLTQSWRVEAEEFVLPSTVKKYPDKDRLERVRANRMTLYTNDPSADVRAFYRKTLGGEPDGQGRFCVFRLVAPAMDDNFWVEVEERAARDHFFSEGLDREIMMEQDPAARGGLQKLRERYAYLAEGWYPDFDPQKKMEACVSANRFHNDRKVRQNRASQEDMARQIQQLIAQGRFQEAAALGQGGLRGSM